MRIYRLYHFRLEIKFVEKFGKAKKVEELEPAESELEDMIEKLIQDEKIQQHILRNKSFLQSLF